MKKIIIFLSFILFSYFPCMASDKIKCSENINNKLYKKLTFYFSQQKGLKIFQLQAIKTKQLLGLKIEIGGTNYNNSIYYFITYFFDSLKSANELYKAIDTILTEQIQKGFEEMNIHHEIIFE